ncbi:MAG: AraC family transcriptional regulator [Candidatus Eisenbacteria bacterium]|nr:AraC family transcriptional regulator [Candidatus Eisenbacteria bacterium]
MWTRTGTVLTVSSRAMVGACEGLGLDAAELLRAAGVPREQLDDPDARLDAAVVGRLWEKAYELSRDPVLSLHAAEACPLGAYKVIDFMAANAATVGEAFRFAARYFHLINTAIRLPIDESGDPVTLDIVEEGGAGPVARAFAEYCFAAFVLHVRAATEAPVPLLRVTFVHPAPADPREHRRIFGCTVEFEARRCRIEIGRAAWDTPTAHAHPGVLQVLSEHADRLLRDLPRGPALVERTRQAIGARLRGDRASLEAVARELGMSPRSLQRRLGELGCSYITLADQVRRATAQLYLEQPDIAIAEIAYLLGFADPSTFHRAFKRWTGETPSRAREKSRRSGA